MALDRYACAQEGSDPDGLERHDVPFPAADGNPHFALQPKEWAYKKRGLGLVGSFFTRFFSMVGIIMNAIVAFSVLYAPRGFL